jgi:hypothetical protein
MATSTAEAEVAATRNDDQRGIFKRLTLPDWPAWVWAASGGIGVMISLFVIWIIVRFVHYTGTDLKMKQRMIGESAATRLEGRRREVEAQLTVKDAWLRVTSQIAADALDRPVEIDAEIPPRVGGKPVPYFTVTAHGGTRYVFTTDIEALQGVGILRKRKGFLRRGPRTVGLPPIEPGLVWQYLADKFLRQANEVIPAVPRDATWSLVVMKGER